MNPYDLLNREQKSAVDFTEGPLLVLAGPGTGKTQLLSVRAASILKKVCVHPENILILTYTNPAARTMKERLAAVIGQQGYDIEVNTFHGFANSVLQDSADAADYLGDRILMDEVEQVKAIEHVLGNTEGVDEIRPFRSPSTYVREILKKISELKKDDITPEGLKNYLKGKKSSYRLMEEKHIARLKAFSAVYDGYEELKAAGGNGVFDERPRYDFDDMIIFAVQALRREALLRKECRQTYRYIMVDEFQDTNGAQLDLLFELAEGEGANICCVGDDDQSIYRFQGANIGNFKALERRFPGINKIYLKDNYRSPDNLISASGRILGLLDVRVADKESRSAARHQGRDIAYREFSTEEEELIYIADKVKELGSEAASDMSLSPEERAHPLNGIAVLVRKRLDIMKVVDIFLRLGIPYATDGKEDIGGERRVGQLLDALYLARIDPVDAEAKDTALYKVLAADYFGIPKADLLRFINFANERKKGPEGEKTILAEFMAYFSEPGVRIRMASPEAFERAYGAVKRLIDDAYDIPVHMLLVNYIIDSCLYSYILKEYSDKGILRIRQLRALGSFVNMARGRSLADPSLRLGAFLDEIETRKSHGMPIQGDLVTMSQEGVRIYTAHGSKGLEFRSVIIPFCLQNKNWPGRPVPEKIPLPADLLRNRPGVKDREESKRLYLQDEARLFYVAVTRAKSDLIFTASPEDNRIASSYLDMIGVHALAPEDKGSPEEALIGKSLDKPGADDLLAGTDEILSDMVSSMTLNPTRINNYLLCRRKFFYNDVLKLPGAKKKSLVFGNCVHKALEETYKKFMKSRRFPPLEDFYSFFSRELRFQGVDKAMERECLKKMKTLKGWFERESARGVMPISLERKLMVTIGDNIIFTGKYDKVEWEDEKKGHVRILDYKSGKPDDHIKSIDRCAELSSPDCDAYLRQLAAYKLLFERDAGESKGRKATSLTLVFVEPLAANIARSSLRKGDYVYKSVVVTDKMVSDLERIIVDVWNGIKEKRFDKLSGRDDDTCGRCDFDSICWR